MWPYCLWSHIALHREINFCMHSVSVPLIVHKTHLPQHPNKPVLPPNLNILLRLIMGSFLSVYNLFAVINFKKVWYTMVNVIRCKNGYLKQKVLWPSATVLGFKSCTVKDKLTPSFLEYHLWFIPSLFMLTFSGTELGHATRP